MSAESENKDELKKSEFKMKELNLSEKTGIQRIPDSTGNTMLLFVRKKKPHLFVQSMFNEDFIDSMPDYKLKDDDILLCSYTKCGCHWLWEITRQLLTGEAITQKIEKESSMMEFHGVYTDLDSLPSPRILNNHGFFDGQPKDMLRKKIKVLFVYRNPKDVVVSYYHHCKRLQGYYQFTGDFSSFLIRFAEGLLDNNSMFDYLRSWEEGMKANPDMNVFFVSYEDLQEDPLPHLRRLSKFLGKDYDNTFLQSVVKSTSFDSMKTEKGEILSDSKGSIMYRKGKVGDWKNHFTVAQSEWFDHIIRTRMGGSQLFKFRYSIL